MCFEESVCGVGIELVLINTGENRSCYPRYHPSCPVSAQLDVRGVVTNEASHKSGKPGYVSRESSSQSLLPKYWSGIHHCKLSLIEVDLHAQYKQLAGESKVRSR